MKYISVVILIALMSWTWCLATTERSFSLEDHKRVEDGVAQNIDEFINRKYPGTKVYCQELYTEVVEPNTVMLAHFRCSSEGKSGADETVTQTFEGQIRLESSDDFKTWRETGGTIKAPVIAFENGTKITSSDKEYPPAPAPGTAAEAPPVAAPAPAHKSEHK